MTAKILTAVFAALLLLTAPACNTMRGTDAVTKYNADPLTVVVPADISPAMAQSMMVRAFQNRGWTVISTTADGVVGQLDHRDFEATTTMVYSGSTIKIFSDATYYVAQRDEKQPAVPLGWLKNLQEDLIQYLSKG